MARLLRFYTADLNFPNPMVAARFFAGVLVHYRFVQKIMHGEEILPIERDRLVKGLMHQMLADYKPSS